MVAGDAGAKVHARRSTARRGRARAIALTLAHAAQQFAVEIALGPMQLQGLARTDELDELAAVPLAQVELALLRGELPVDVDRSLQRR
jgi:hypothetical protein